MLYVIFEVLYPKFIKTIFDNKNKESQEYFVIVGNSYLD